jgi:hypothetical protein
MDVLTTISDEQAHVVSPDSRRSVVMTFSERGAMVRIAVAACAASLLAILAFTALAIAGHEIDALSSEVTIMLFAEAATNSKNLAALEIDARTIAGVDSVVVKPSALVKEEFASRFATNVGTTLTDNPFPNEFVLTLKPDARTKERIDSIVGESLRLPNVSDVQHNAAFVQAVEAKSRQYAAVQWIAGGILALVVLTLLWTVLFRLPLTLQQSAVAVVIGSFVAVVLATSLYTIVGNLFPWLREVGITGMMKVALLGSVMVWACATVLLAVNTVRSVSSSLVHSNHSQSQSSRTTTTTEA